MIALLLPLTHRPDLVPNQDRRSKFERDLVLALKAGEPASIEKLYKMYAPSLLGIISSVIKNDDIAEDVLQESFLKIWRSIGQYDPDKGRLFTWMARLSKNTAIDLLRSRGELNSARNEDVEGLIVEIDQLHYTNYNPDTLDLKKLLSLLTPIQMRILNLIYFEGYTQLEVAEELSIPVGTVKTRVRSAILMLRSFF